MTSPTQRRHDEILGRLDALIDAVQSTTARDHLHRLLAEESAAERRDEAVDVTEEPPVESCGDLHPEDRAAFCLQPSGHDSWHDTGDGRRWKVDTAPDVDPDEARRTIVNLDADAERLRLALGHMEADVERLTRERDEAERSRDREANRYEALRADVVALKSRWLDADASSQVGSFLRAVAASGADDILRRDDKRVRG